MNPGDKLHSQAVALSKSHTKLTTTQEVLSEFLTFFCCKGDRLRQTAYDLVKIIQSNPKCYCHQADSRIIHERDGFLC